jgi:Histidine kinase-, DNA gyrase B-, and HSP90-like ATPase
MAPGTRLTSWYPRGMETYTVRSDDPAYPAWMAAVAAGQVQPAFDTRYLDHGLIERTFRDDFAANPEIGFDPEYFDRVFLEYRDWRMKWWRECVQNSVDAKASQIDLAVAQAPDGTWVVSCTDNGKGMDATTVTEKFLKMGGTGKGDRSASSIGGFGKAKELLAFPWLAWEVWTRDVLVTGSGSHYDVTSAPEYLDGTRLQVVMPADKATSISDAMEFLGRCRIPRVQFYLNGERFRAGGLRRGKLVEEWAFGDLYRNKSDHRGVLYVRADGMYMFTADSFPSRYGTLVLELKGDTTKLLMPNREKFQSWENESALRHFISELESEGERTLRKKEKLFTEVWKGTGQITTQQGVSSVLDTVGPLPATDARGLIISKSSASDLAAALERMAAVLQHSEGNLTMSPASGQIVEQIVHEPLKGQSNLEALAQQLVWTPDFMVENEVPGLNIPPKFKPTGMSGRMVALAQVWAEACRWVFIQLGRSAEYGVGFVFSDNALAVCKQDTNGYWLLLNPLRTVAPLKERQLPAKGMLYKSSRDDMKSLYARAVHEVTHMDSGFMRHESSFAAALTENFAKCADGFKVMWKIAQGIKAPKIEKAPKRKARPKHVTVDLGWSGDELLLYDRSGEALDYASELAGTKVWGDTITLTSMRAISTLGYAYVAPFNDFMDRKEMTAALPTRLVADLLAMKETSCYTAEIPIDVYSAPNDAVDLVLAEDTDSAIYLAQLEEKTTLQDKLRSILTIPRSSSTFNELEALFPREPKAGGSVQITATAAQWFAWYMLHAPVIETSEIQETINVTVREIRAHNDSVLELINPSGVAALMASELAAAPVRGNVITLRSDFAMQNLNDAYISKEVDDLLMSGQAGRIEFPTRLFADLLALANGYYTAELLAIAKLQGSAVVSQLDLQDPNTGIYSYELIRQLNEAGADEMAGYVLGSSHLDFSDPRASELRDQAKGELKTDDWTDVATTASQWMDWVNPEAAAPTEFEYGAYSRPPGYGSVPDGHIAIGHNELFPFGTVTYARRLTPAEQDHFTLVYIPTLDELEALAEEIATDLGDYRQKWLELVDRGDYGATLMIEDAITEARMATPGDDYMLRQVATRVRRQLAAEG